LELLFGFGILFAIGFTILVFLKLLFALLVLPFKVAFWVARGVLGVFIVIPLAILFTNLFSLALPIALFLLMLLPVALGIGLLVLLFKLVF